MWIILCFASMLIGARGEKHTLFTQPPGSITTSSFQATNGEEIYEVWRNPPGPMRMNNVVWKIDSINLDDGDDSTVCGGKLSLYKGTRDLDGNEGKRFKELCETTQVTDDMVYMTNTKGSVAYIAENDQVEGVSISLTNFTCGGSFNQTSGTLSSPKFENGGYPNHASCGYVIHAPEGKNVELTFTELNFPDDEGNPADCSGDHDKVSVYNGIYISNRADHDVLKGRHCNGPNEQTKTYTSSDNGNSGNGICLQFLSNGAGRGVGFTATWKYV